jgi:hypothetical protein
MLVAAVGFLVMGLAAPWSAGGEAAPAAPAAPAVVDVGAVRDKVFPGACQVTVLNSWGLPAAYTNGFLMGQGHFVVTDLGAVGQPGVASVGLKFWSGSAASAKEFGLADTSTGLVALKIEAESARPGGLDLATEAPLIGTLPTAAAVGWPWCKELCVAPGHMGQGPAIKDLAQRCGIAAPEGVEGFLRIEGVRLDAASGAPVVNAQGAVVAVKLDIAARGLAISLAVPAAPFRASLLGAQPQLKALSELPKPVWPVRLLRLPGEPPASAEFAKAAQAVRTGMVCPTCNGKPRTWAGGLLGGPPGGPLGWGCPMCRGEGVAFTPALETVLAKAALDGTRGLWAPVADDRGRAVFRAAGREVLKILTQAPQRFQTSLATGIWSEMGQWAAGTLPRGGVFYGEVRETVDGPDGKYVFLKPQRAREAVAVRADLLAEAVGKAASAKEWTPGMQVALLGAVVGRFRAPSGEHAFYVLPLDWQPTPGLEITMPEFGPPRGFDRPDRGDRPNRGDQQDRGDRPNRGDR